MSRKRFGAAQRPRGSATMTKSPQYLLYYSPDPQSSGRCRGKFGKESNFTLEFVGHGSRRNRDAL